MKNNKKILFILCIFITIISLVIFIYNFMTKKNKIGNNMNSQEIVEYILNIKSYKSNVTIQINSNKNQNKYVLNQQYNLEEGSIQEVVEPQNIAGVKIIKKNDKLTIENTTLNLSKIYENYNCLEENNLDLISFINDYKNDNNSGFEENNDELIMKATNSNGNKYNKNKILYINKLNYKPTKMIIEDNNQKATTNILYNEIEIN